MSRMPGTLQAVAATVVVLLTGWGYAQSGPDPQRANVRQDITQLRAGARAQIRAVLTPEQQAKFDALPVLQGMPGPHGMGRGRGPCAGGPAGAEGANAPHWFLERLTKELNLTDAERASIQPILDQARSAKQTRRDQARTAFRALLTPEQTAKLDELKAQPGFRKSAMRDELQLTDEQKTQAHEIFAQLRTDMQQMRADAREQIRTQLTPEQQTQFDALRLGGKWGGKHGMGMAGGPAWRTPGVVLDRLSSELSLTDAQRASVKSILDDLHTTIRERIHEARAAAGAPAT